MAPKRKQTKGSPNKKKKRESNDGHAAAVERNDSDRPDPTPLPPASLVNLLRRDANVMEYFVSLQENLDYDVEKWKKRAKVAQAENERLNRELHEMMQSRRTEQKSPPESPSPATRKRPLPPQDGRDFVDHTVHHRRDKSELESHKDNDETRMPTDAGNAPSNSMTNSKGRDGSNTISNDIGNPQRSTTDVWDDPTFDLEFSSSSDEEDSPKVDKEDVNDQKVQATIEPHTANEIRMGTSSESHHHTSEEMVIAKDTKGDRQHRHRTEIETTDMDLSDSSSDHHSEGGTKREIPRRIRSAWENLRIAQQHLEELGIHLTESLTPKSTNEIETSKTQTPTKMDNDDEIHDNDQPESEMPAHPTDAKLPPTSGDGECDAGGTTPIIKRRSDLAVLNDILHTIKAWTKLKVATPSSVSQSGTDSKDGMERQGGQLFAPFMTQELVPCFEPLPPLPSLEIDQAPVAAVQHPAVRGVDLLLQALSLMDAFSPAVDEIEEQGYIEQLIVSPGQDSALGGGRDEKGEVTTVLNSSQLFGMKKRHYMVQRFVTSLEGEICHSWPYLDRTSRISTPSLHYSNTDKERVLDDDDLDEEGDNGDKTTLSPNHGDETSDVPSKKVSFASKNALRLAALAERCILARIVVAIHLHRQDPASALRLVLNYILSTAPSLGLQKDCYPRLPPVQSICIVEAILQTSVTKTLRPSPSRGRIQLIDYFTPTNNTGRMDNENRISNALHVALTTTATIYESRSDHIDSRISEIARVEVASYRRLIVMFQSTHSIRDAAGTAITVGFDSLSMCADNIKVLADEYSNVLERGPFGSLSDSTKLPGSTVDIWILPLFLTMQGDLNCLRSLFTAGTSKFQASGSERDLIILLACARALRQLEIRRIDSYREVVASTLTTKVATISQSVVDNLVLSVQKCSTISNHDSETILELLLGICQELADGQNALRLVHWYTSNSKNGDLGDCLAAMSLLRRPMARVITLERREDRRAAFVSQAMQEGLWVIKGVIPPECWRNYDVDEYADSYLAGTYAIDGSQGTPAAVERELMDWVRRIRITDPNIGHGSTNASLDTLVAPQWRPNDLRAFDIYAPDDPTLTVSLSPSEKACALSHIATWWGVAMGGDSSSSSSGRPHWAGCGTASAAVAAGWARGEPLHPPSSSSSTTIPPTPVALILEDDAILVDRFVDRLDELLNELPKDFHYCAIGYGKPKNAPLVDCPTTTTATTVDGGTIPPKGICQHIRLPTMTWYLTGYLLSQEGAKYLLKNLPVVGPVDAWIGRTMILRSNWENDYGHRVGVGTVPHQLHHKDGATTTTTSSSTATLSRKELRTCLQFRAYCATVPLCHQKVESGSNNQINNNKNKNNDGTGRQQPPRQNWRQRDSDIVYSGHVGSTTRPPDRGGNEKNAGRRQKN